MKANSTSRSPISQGLWLGLLGIVIFSVTLPMTRLAVGTADAPQMSGAFIAFGRAVVAAGLSAVFLLATRAPLPQRQHWLPLAMTALGVVFGFPLLTSIAMRYVEAVHASVIVGVLPLATAAVGALLHRQRPSSGFWWCAAVGSAMVVAFAVLRSGGGGGSVHFADGLLLAAMLCAAIGYGYGGRLSQQMRAEHVICWALVISLPLTLPLALLTYPVAPMKALTWAAFGYVAVFSMLLGLRAAGEQLGWGFQLQSPAVVAALAVLFTLMGLNLAGLFEFGRSEEHTSELQSRP